MKEKTKYAENSRKAALAWKRRQVQKGFKNVCVWIPKEREAEFRRFVKKLKEDRNASKDKE